MGAGVYFARKNCRQAAMGPLHGYVQKRHTYGQKLHDYQLSLGAFNGFIIFMGFY